MGTPLKISRGGYNRWQAEQIVRNLDRWQQGIILGASLIPAGGGAGGVRAAAFARKAGAAGEEAVRAVRNIGPKVRIRVNGRIRYPDGLLPDELNEVKNVLRIYLSRQLRDDLDFVRQTGRILTVWLRRSARQSGPFAKKVETGEIRVEDIP